LADIDNVVAFMENRSKNFLLMHCVAAYPTRAEDLQLNQIDLLKNRYPKIPIGYSTHENPSETIPVAMAIAKGCAAFEKHVGIRTEKYSLNDYSATPEQVHTWLSAAQSAYAMAGVENKRMDPSRDELASLISLRRGVFVKRDVTEGERLSDQDVFMAIPTQGGHITANDWSKYNRYYATRSLKAGEAVLSSNTRKEGVRDTIYSIVQRVKESLKRGNIVVPGEAQLEISHHYGVEKFDEYGITMITVVNREYCKKLIVVLPGQKHPTQYHKLKEETFHILHGSLTMTLDGVTKEYHAGSVITVEKGVHHAFESKTGAVFEEISSTHHINDSYYVDPAINSNRDRKTFLTHWMN
jgi:quercetin dioxygenase-like cupin family protein